MKELVIVPWKIEFLLNSPTRKRRREKEVRPFITIPMSHTTLFVFTTSIPRRLNVMDVVLDVETNSDHFNL